MVVSNAEALINMAMKELLDIAGDVIRVNEKLIEVSKMMQEEKDKVK